MKRTSRYKPRRVKSKTKRARSASAMFHQLIEKDADGMIVVDSRGVVRFANPAAESILGRKVKDLTGRPFDHPVVPNQTVEIAVQGGSGTTKSVEMRATEIVWKRRPAHLASIRDVTELRNIEKLKAEVDESRRLDQMKDEFVGMVSHELRTPLTIIKAAISNLKDGVVGGLNDKQARIVDATSRNVDRLSRLIEDLLSLSRLKSGRVRMNRRRLSLEKVVSETVEGFQAVARDHQIALVCDIPPDLPAVYADPDMVVQVITNLVTNSLRFAKSRINVKAGLAQSDGETRGDEKRHCVVVSVADDGIGIPKEGRGDLFKKFVRLHGVTDRDSYRGTGLGLAICKEIVDAHEGKIWFEEPKTPGACFAFILPLYEEGEDLRAALREILAAAEEDHGSVALVSVVVCRLHRDLGEAAFGNLFREMEERIVSQVLRRDDRLYHYSGNEWMIILPEAGREGARSVAERIRKVVASCAAGEAETAPGLEIGLAIYPDDGSGVDGLIAAAREKESARLPLKKMEEAVG